MITVTLQNLEKVEINGYDIYEMVQSEDGNVVTILTNYVELDVLDSMEDLSAAIKEDTERLRNYLKSFNKGTYHV